MEPFHQGRPFRYDPATETGKKPPNAAGEYRILTRQGTIKYIGISADLYRRMMEHIRSGKLSLQEGDRLEYQVAKEEVCYNDLQVHEKRKIEQHAPPANKRAGGGGRGKVLGGSGQRNA